MRGLRTAVGLFLCVATLFAAAEPQPATPSPNSSFTIETVAFRGNSGILHGYVYKPAGRKPPFPAVIFFPDPNKPLFESGPSTQFENLARFWTTKGYVLFIPDHQQKTSVKSGGAEAGGAQDPSPDEDKIVEQLLVINKDVVAATEWLKGQSFTDEDRVIMMGTMSGAIHTIICAEKGLGVKAFIAFSPATVSWNTHPMLQALLRRGVRNSKVPVFLIQAQNDKSLAPSAILGKELMNKGAPNRTKVYPPYGTLNTEARNFSINGSQVWGSDVISFLKEALSQ